MNTAKIHAIRVLAISAAITLGFATAGASAGTAEAVFVRDGAINYVVRFPDLDLNKIEGAAALYSRLNHAGQTVCAPLQSRDLKGETTYRACVQQAVANAVAGINRPLVWQYHQSRTKGDKALPVQLAKAD